MRSSPKRQPQRPIRLTHVFSEAIPSPSSGEDVSDADVVRHHAYLTERMNRLMEEALAY